MKHIEQLYIHGFKTIDSLEHIDLDELNIIIGANGSGKSTILQALELMGQSLRDSNRVYSGSKHLLHSGHERAEIAVNIGGATAQTSLTLETMLDQVQLTSTINVPSHLSHSISSWRIFNFYQLGNQPFPHQDNLLEHSISPDAANLPNLIARLRRYEPARYDLIVDTMRRSYPPLAQELLQPDAPNYEDCSPGTLKILAYAAMAHTPPELLPSVIMMERPETDLDPYNVRNLASLLRQLAVQHQIILTTDSPQLVKALQPANVLHTALLNAQTICWPATPNHIKYWSCGPAVT